MKIVLATLNSKYIHSSLSLWCLKAGVENFCSSAHSITVIESTINADENDFLDKIIGIQPDIVAFSCYIWNIEKITQLTKKIKMRLSCNIVLGGPEVQYRQENILSDNPSVDFILCGEGEWTFSSFIEAVEQGYSFFECEGLTFREHNNIISVPSKTHNETPPSPYCEAYFEKLDGRISYIEASRGCPFRCAYCLSGRLSVLRYFNYEQICNDIIRLSQSGTSTIKFIDRTFNANAENANRILNFIKENYGTIINKNVCFHFEIAADILTEQTFEILSSMPCGLCQLEIGIQSFNNTSLKAINRKSDLNKLHNNISRLLSLKNIHIHIDLIAGLPYEDMKSFRNSFNRAYSIKADMLQLGFLKLLHGADMREYPEIYPCEFNSSPPYEISENPWLKGGDLIILKGCEEALDRLYNSGRFLMTLEYLFDIVGFDPFDTFCSFGMSKDFSKISLSEFTLYVFNYFKDKCNENILREMILCDLASLPVNMRLPDDLKIYDPDYKKIKKKYSEMLQKNVRIVVLYSKQKVFVVHTDKKDQIKNRYFSEYYDLQ